MGGRLFVTFSNQVFFLKNSNEEIDQFEGLAFFTGRMLIPCFYPVFFISYTYLAQKLHGMNTLCPLHQNSSTFVIFACSTC